MLVSALLPSVQLLVSVVLVTDVVLVTLLATLLMPVVGVVPIPPSVVLLNFVVNVMRAAIVRTSVEMYS